MSDYYISQPGDEEAQGPFTEDDLAAMANEGRLGPSTYYYDPKKEDWLLIITNQALKEKLFPPKTNQTFYQTQKPAKPDSAKKGKLDACKQSPLIFLASGLSMMLFAAAFSASLFDGTSPVGKAEFWFAGIDAVIGLFLLLTLKAVLPLSRFRLTIGLGYWSYILLSWNQPLLFATMGLAHICLYITSFRMPVFISLPFAMMGLASSAVFALLSWL